MNAARANAVPGRCRFCGITEDQIDGDRHRWLGDSRTGVREAGLHPRPLCAEADRRKFEDRQRNRKRTPAEIHELIRGRGRKPKAVGPKQQRLKKTRGAAHERRVSPVLGPPGGKPGCEHETRPGTLVRSGGCQEVTSRNRVLTINPQTAWAKQNVRVCMPCEQAGAQTVATRLLAVANGGKRPKSVPMWY